MVLVLGIILLTCTISMYTEYLLIEIHPRQKLHSEPKQIESDEFRRNRIGNSSSSSFASRKDSKLKGKAEPDKNQRD